MNNIRRIVTLISIVFCVVASIDCFGQGKITRPKIQYPASSKTSNISYDERAGVITNGRYEYKLIKIIGGTFFMGISEKEESYHKINGTKFEKPAHKVKIDSYILGATEVPQWLWTAVMRNNPSEFKGDLHPVENVSWRDCQKFIRQLTKIIGVQFSLPTEAQWEYAAKGGNKSDGYVYSGSDDINDVAWWGFGWGNPDNAKEGTYEIGIKKPNELGLYDMSGNVFEWVKDNLGYYDDQPKINPIGNIDGEKIVRGGSWSYFNEGCLVSSRSTQDIDDRVSLIGFRIAINQTDF